MCSRFFHRISPRDIGDYRSADHYAWEADKHRYRAWRDTGYAEHEERATLWDDWHGY